MILKQHPYLNLDTNINTKHCIVLVSLLVKAWEVYPNQIRPLLEPNAFAHSSGIHQDGVIKHRETYEIIDPKDVRSR